MTKLRFEDEVEAILVDAYQAAFGRQPTDKWLTAITMRVGTTGEVATLDEAGEAVGVTRERMRQVMTKLERQLKGREIPSAKAIAETLIARSPVPEPIGRRLGRSGATRPGLTGKAFLNILELVGTSPTALVGTDLVRVDDWVVEESEVPVMKSVGVARKHTSKYGMTTVEEIRQELATPEAPLDGKDIMRVLRRESTVKWAGEWLWIEKPGDSEHDNSMVNIVRQVLSVNSPQTIASVREGVRRYFKFRRRDVIPPTSAMREFLLQHQAFVVDGDNVHTVDSLDYHEELGPAAALVVDVLKASEYGAMDWQALLEACQEVDINKNSLTVWSTYAPWLDRVGTRVFALRGANPNPAAVSVIRQVAKQRVAEEAKRTEWTWGASGEVILTMYVTSNFLGTGTFPAWSNRPGVIVGREIPIAVEGAVRSTMKTSASHGWVWGLGKTLTTLKADVGDVLRIVIDPVSGTGSAVVGGSELWG